MGERGFELPATTGSPGRWKTGDGQTHWNDLKYDDDPTRIHGATAAGVAILTGNVFKQLVRNPDALIADTTTMVRNSDYALTSAAVVWPDGTPGTYTALTLSTTFPGAVDSYQITYGSPVTSTYTQPAVTRNTDGVVTALPGIVVS